MELLFTHWLHLLQHIPVDAFSAGWGGKGTLIAPELSRVERVDETLQVDVLLSCVVDTAVCGVGWQVVPPGVQEEVTCWACSLSVEKDSNYATELFISIAVYPKVHNVELHVVVLAVDGVLRWAVHVELFSAEFLLSTILKSLNESALLPGGLPSPLLSCDCSTRQFAIAHWRVHVESQIVVGNSVAKVNRRLLPSGTADVCTGACVN